VVVLTKTLKMPSIVSFFKATNDKIAQKTSLLSKESEDFLKSFTNKKHEVRKETEPEMQQVVAFSGKQDFAETIIYDVCCMEQQKSFTSTRWRVPEGENAKSVVKRCSKACSRQFHIERVGTLEYIRVTM